MFVICPKCAAKYRIPPEITLKTGQRVQCSACQHIFNFQPVKEDIVNESSDIGLQVPENPVLVQTETVIQTEKVTRLNELPEVFKPLEPMPKQFSYAWLWGIVCLVLFFICLVGVWLYRDLLKVDYTPVASVQTRKVMPRIKETPPISSEKKSFDEVVEIPLFEGENLSQMVSVPSSSAQVDNFRFHSIRFRKEASGILIEGMIHNNTDEVQPMPTSIYATAFDRHGNILFTKEIFLPKEILQPYGQKAFFGSYSPAPDGVQWIEVSCKN